MIAALISIGVLVAVAALAGLAIIWTETRGQDYDD